MLKPVRANKPNIPNTGFRLMAERVRFSDVQADGAQADAPKLRRFDMLMYTGGKMSVANWQHPVVIDIAGVAGMDRRRPALKDHDTADPVGHFEGVTATNSEINAWGIVSGTGKAAKEVSESSRNGFPWQASIGVDPQRVAGAVEFVPRGKTSAANGQMFDGPAFVLRKSIWVEGSFVALGADDNTSARVAAKSAPKESANMDPFDKWLEDLKLVRAELSEEQIATLRAKYDAEVKASADGDGEGEGDGDGAPTGGGGDGNDPPGDSMKAARKAQAEETRRVAAIRKTCNGRHADIEAKAIEEGWNTDRVELEVLRAERPKHLPGYGGGVQANHEFSAIEAALCMSAGISEKRVAESIVESERQKVMNAACSRQFRGMGIQQLVYEVIRAAGMHAPVGRMDNETIRTALEADKMLRVRASGGFSTISLSGTLGNVANKSLLEAFMAVPTVADVIAAQSNVNDFKQATRYRVTMNGTFQKVGPTGELKHATMSEESYTNQVDPYGLIIALTRVMMVNDDLGAFLQIPRMLGRGGALAREEAVMTLLLANTGSFFSTGHTNYKAGSETVLSINGLSLARQYLSKQTDSAGKPVMISPEQAILLVPPELQTLAEMITSPSRLLEAATAGSPTPDTNPHVGKYMVKSSPYLSNSEFSGYSTTAWYVITNPANIAALEVAYLRGQRTPIIESSETDFDTLGMKWRGYWDFGVNFQDYRAAFKAKGAA